MTKDYYRILGVLDDAEDVVIRAAYKALAQRYHPDKWTGDKEEANRRMQEINEAYGVLSDSAKRKQYDATRDKSEYEDDEYGSNSEEGMKSLDAMNSDWEVACGYFSDLPKIVDSLNKISKVIGFTFKLVLLETKSFNDRHKIAMELEVNFLEKYFGKDRYIVSFAREVILEGNRSAAKELNDLVRVLGNSIDSYDVVDKVSKKYQTNRYKKRNFELEEEDKEFIRFSKLISRITIGFALFVFAAFFLILATSR